MITAFDLFNADETPLRASDHEGLVRFILDDQDGDGAFDTTLPNGCGAGLDRGFTLVDPAGCPCEQIIVELNLGKGHTRFGCGTDAVETWIQGIQP